MAQETIIRSKAIYEGKTIHLSVTDVQLPNGREVRRELIRHPGAVGIVALDQDNQVILVRQYRFAANQTLLEIPAGTMERGEDPQTCAVRELQEEAGYKPGNLQPLGSIFVAPSYSTENIHLFLATALTPSRLQADDDEFIEVERCSLPDALRMIETGEICDAKSVSGLLRVARLFDL